MVSFALPALYALFAWWFSTGAILYLDGLPQRTFRWSMVAGTLLSGLAAYGLFASRADLTPTGAYLAFTSGLLIWAWLEMTYYMGFVTGPRRQPCPQGCSGWRHFGHAVRSSLYHELATIGLAAMIYGATRGVPNQIAWWTFVVLWWVQISAKLNVFLGVPNVSEEFVPEHLAFLKSFLNKKPMNLLFPVSVTVSVVLATLLAQKAVVADATPFEATGFTFLGTLMALAILEHWFLVLPIPADALWRWSLKSRRAPPAASTLADLRGLESVQTPQRCVRCAPSHDPLSRDLDHDDFGSSRSKIMNVIGSSDVEHDVARKPMPTFRHHALGFRLRRGSDRSSARNLVAGVFAEADLAHPAAPSIARRQT